MQSRDQRRHWTVCQRNTSPDEHITEFLTTNSVMTYWVFLAVSLAFLRRCYTMSCGVEVMMGEEQFCRSNIIPATVALELLTSFNACNDNYSIRHHQLIRNSSAGTRPSWRPPATSKCMCGHCKVMRCIINGCSQQPTATPDRASTLVVIAMQRARPL